MPHFTHFFMLFLIQLSVLSRYMIPKLTFFDITEGCQAAFNESYTFGRIKYLPYLFDLAPGRLSKLEVLREALIKTEVGR